MYIIYILAQKIINNICNIYNILFGFFFSGLDRVRIGYGFRVGFRYRIPKIQIQIQTRSGLKIKSKSKISGSVKSIRVETVGYPFGSDFSVIPT